jgi:hypothetical protein
MHRGETRFGTGVCKWCGRMFQKRRTDHAYCCAKHRVWYGRERIQRALKEAKQC